MSAREQQPPAAEQEFPNVAEAEQEARAVVHSLQAAGHEAYWAGGCVRDRLLGRRPVDYDVATNAVPEEVMRLFPRYSAVGAQFGVVLVHPPSKRDVAVATFRTEGAYADGRHPGQVAYARAAREDVTRRDFTINGLLYDPERERVLDYVGGQADLERRLVRAIGDPAARFGEDRLRLLRAVRFAARFGFEIETETWKAIRENAAQVTECSPERIRDEIIKMLTEGRARRAFELLEASGLLAAVLPEAQRMKGVEQPPQFHPEGDVWTHTLLMLAELPAGASPTLAMGVLLHDAGKPATFRRAPDRIRFDQHAAVGARIAAGVSERLRLPNAQKEQIEALVENHLRFIDAPRMKPSTLKRFLRQPQFDEHLELHRLDCKMSHGDLSTYEFIRGKLAELAPEELRPPRLVSGADLIELGYAPGPLFKEILAGVEEEQLEGRLGERQQAIEWVKKSWPK